MQDSHPRDERPYNNIFETLVRLDVNDDIERVEYIEGLVAYGIYKHEKRRFVVEYWEEHNERPPEREYDIWLRHYKQVRLPSLRRDARKYLKDFQEAATEENRRWMIDAVSEYEKITKRTWFFGFWQSFFASFVFSIFIALLGFLALYRYDLADLLRGVADALGNYPRTGQSL